MLKKRNFQMFVLIVLIGIALVITVSASKPQDITKADLTGSLPPEFSHPEEEKVAPLLYRNRLDECFDVSLRELAACRNTSQEPSAIPVTGE